MADLEAFFRHRAAFVGAEASVGRLIFSDEFFHLAGDSAQACLQRWRSQNMSYLKERLQKLLGTNSVRTDLDVEAMIMFIQDTLLTFALHASLGTSDSSAALAPRIDKAWSALQTILLP